MSSVWSSVYEYINVHVCLWECACENVCDWECMSLAVWMCVCESVCNCLVHGVGDCMYIG